MNRQEEHMIGLNQSYAFFYTKTSELMVILLGIFLTQR